MQCKIRGPCVRFSTASGDLRTAVNGLQDVHHESGKLFTDKSLKFTTEQAIQHDTNIYF